MNRDTGESPGENRGPLLLYFLCLHPPDRPASPTARFIFSRQGEFRAQGRGSLLAAAARCTDSLSVPPAAPFLSAAKEMGERTPPKTNGFWNSFRPITATPQKGPRRIAPAPIPAAASTCRGKMPYPTAVEQCTSAWYVGAAAIRGLHAIRCTTMFGNLSRAWYAAAVFSAPQPRRKS